MSAWGNRSSSPLLQRIADSHTPTTAASTSPITTLTLLPGKTFSPSNQLTALHLFDRLLEVNLSGKVWSDLSALSGKLSSETCTLQILRLGTSEFTSEDLSTLLPSQNTSLLTLDLSSKSLTTLPCLKPFKTLQNLDVSRNSNLKITSSKKLSDLCSSTLKDINLSECPEILSSVEEDFFDVHLNSLDISLIKPGSYLNKLTSKVLDINLTGIEGLETYTLFQGSHLVTKKLNLKDCKLKSCGGFKNFENIEEIVLEGNPDVINEDLIDGFRSSLKLLDLSNCGFDNISVSVFSKVLGLELNTLRLFNNKLYKHESLNEIWGCLISNLNTSKIVNVDLGGNEIPQEFICSLFESLHTPSHLKTLELGGNKFGPQSDESLKILKNNNPELDVARDIPER
ncbi:hypothetical protein TL16_g07340 [Triparma laevis f. inornata]|nr:hypothetical protein TL16_g07340 [Triparma laevis f. inornata]GMI08614.1 hypothetical protein TrLO_g12633 [Triparma laevis f. longispina]